MLRYMSRLVIVSLLCAGLYAVAPSAEAASIAVNTTKDVENNSDGKCSLREAIRAANRDASYSECAAGSGADVIKLAEGKTYRLSTDGLDDDSNYYGDLDISGALNIVGARGTTIRQTVADARVIDVLPGASVRLTKLTLTGGSGGSFGDYGGGIKNRGVLEVSRVRVVGNQAGDGVIQGSPGDGGWGGAIYNTGTLTIFRCVISDNRAGNGAGGVADIEGGKGGSGGALYNSEIGQVVIERTTFRSNSAGNGGTGRPGFSIAVGGTGGAGGSGGAIFSLGQTTISDSVFTGNAAGDGGPGGVGTAGAPTPGGTGGTGGHGGAIDSDGLLAISTTTVSGNTAGGGGDGGTGGEGAGVEGGWGGNAGPGGDGGGVRLTESGTIFRTTVSSNVTGIAGAVGAGGNGPPAGGSGDAASDGFGGGVAAFFANIGMANSTLSGNDANAGYGGGLYNSSNLSANNLTIARNTAATGGGLANDAPLSLYNSILADNAAATSPDCHSVTATSNGHNIVETQQMCSGLQATDAAVDPLLGPLRDNGGPTRTHAIRGTSPARNAGDPGTPGTGGTTCEVRDQRGKKRAGCDIGSYEKV